MESQSECIIAAQQLSTDCVLRAPEVMAVSSVREAGQSTDGGGEVNITRA